tara:strand:- start:49 stop:264 length:216 start_codon:yes stop_codon:yes gene_type:complete
MCFGGGGGGQQVKPLTKEEMEKDTDNPFENMISGVATPEYKQGKKNKQKLKNYQNQLKNQLKIQSNDTYQG